MKLGNQSKKNSDNAVSGMKMAHNKLVALIIITNCCTADLKDKYRVETLADSRRTRLRQRGLFEADDLIVPPSPLKTFIYFGCKLNIIHDYNCYE